MTTLPLDDVRVLDLSDRTGEAACRLLADLGADIIKVEPVDGTTTRSFPVVEGISLPFAVANANKRFGSADFSDTRSLSRLLELATAADVVVLDQTSASALNPHILHDMNPDIVVIVSSPFGSTGPRKHWQATDAVLTALSGSLSRSGRPGDAPLLPPDGIATATAAAHLAWTALVAVTAVRRGMPGQVIDLSHHEAVTIGLDPAFGVQGSAAAGRSGRVHRDRPPADSYPIYPCADGHVRLCLLARRQWRGMRAWLGDPDELCDDRFDLISERVKAKDLIDPLITALFADKRAEDLTEEAAKRGVPLAQVLTLGQAAQEDHFTKAGTVEAVDFGSGVAAPTPIGCIDLDGKRLGIRTVPPAQPAPGLPAWRERAASDTVEQSGHLPFDGLRVLDLGVIVFGAEIGRVFADLGADVVKIESQTYPDGLRQTRGGEPINASFAWGQRNKQSLGLDLRSDEGRDLFLKLVETSDVVLSNFKPNTLDSLGIGPATLHARNPRVVVIESAAFNSRGRWAQRLGYGPLVRAACGISSLWKYGPDDTESWDGVTVYPDHMAAKVGAVAVAAALLRARRTGIGARIELAQSDVVLHQLASTAVHESLMPGTVAATGNRSRGLFGGLFACAGDDEWCVIDAVTVGHVRALQDVVGDLESVADWMAARSPHDAMCLLQEAGVPVAAMLRLNELLDDPQLTVRGTFTRFRHPAMEHDLPTEDTSSPYGLEFVPPLSPAPMAGEHTREIARDRLGLDAETIESLFAQGVLH